MSRYAIAAALVAATLAARPARAEIFVNVPGIPGDVTAAGHEHEIETLSVQFGGGQVVPKSGAKLCAQPSAKTQLSAVVISKLSDKASPKLFMAAAQGTVFPQVTITIATQIAGAFVNLDQYQLSDAFISSYTTSSGGQRPSEVVSFTFRSLQLTHFDPVDPPQSATWAFCGRFMI